MCTDRRLRPHIIDGLIITAAALKSFGNELMSNRASDGSKDLNFRKWMCSDMCFDIDCTNEGMKRCVSV